MLYDVEEITFYLYHIKLYHKNYQFDLPLDIITLGLSKILLAIEFESTTTATDRAIIIGLWVLNSDF